MGVTSINSVGADALEQYYIRAHRLNQVKRLQILFIKEQSDLSQQAKCVRKVSARCQSIDMWHVSW